MLHPGDKHTTFVGLVILGALVTLGVLFRFANLDRRLYWHDEAYTSLMAAGFAAGEVVAEISNGSEVSARELLRYQQPSPEKSTRDTIQSTISGDPHHPMLYYLMSRLWMLSVGYSPAAMRNLAAIISLLVLPAMYWLSLELFGSHRTALFAVALICLSPIHLLLAREAREYSLWTVSILVSSAALLRALRLKSRPSWVLYAAAALLGLYSHLLFSVVLLAHGLYMLMNGREYCGDINQSKKTLTDYLIATLAALIAYTPWIYVVLTNFRTLINSTSWLSAQLPFGVYLKRLGARFSGVFVDLDPFPVYVQLLFILPVLALVGYSLYILWKNESKQVGVFIFLLVGITSAALMLPDFVLGGRRSVLGRYLIPCFIGIQLAVAYSLTSRLKSAEFWQRRVWQLVTMALFSAGILSNILIVQAHSWWDKGSDYGHHQMIRTINESDRALLIVDSSVDNFGTFLGFSHALDPRVHVKWGSNAVDDIRGEYSDIFLFRPSVATQEAIAIKQCQHVEQVTPSLLWRLAEC